MESECQILQWITEGLPSDETSHQNAIILKQVNNMPTLITNILLSLIHNNMFMID